MIFSNQCLTVSSSAAHHTAKAEKSQVRTLDMLGALRLIVTCPTIGGTVPSTMLRTSRVTNAPSKIFIQVSAHSWGFDIENIRHNQNLVRIIVLATVIKVFS